MLSGIYLFQHLLAEFIVIFSHLYFINTESPCEILASLKLMPKVSDCNGLRISASLGTTTYIK